MRTELEGRRPLAKFLSIKLIVMFTFYQSFVVSDLPSNPRAVSLIHGFEDWRPQRQNHQRSLESLSLSRPGRADLNFRSDRLLDSR